jgi:hypothetical protein
MELMRRARQFECGEICMATMRDHKSNRPEQHTVSNTPSGLLAEVRLLNDDQTTMEFVVQDPGRTLGRSDRTDCLRILARWPTAKWYASDGDEAFPSGGTNEAA